MDTQSQDQATDSTADTTVAEAPAAAAKAPRTVAPKIVLSAPDHPDMPVLKYPMPVKAPRFELSINGEKCQAAETAFKDYKYTYFVVNGAELYVKGHLNHDLEYTIAFPEGYDFSPLKVDRQAQAAAAKAAKAKAKEAAGAGTPEGGPESPVEATNGGETGAGSSDAADASTAPESEAPKKGKKASR